jgi:hypothetical protein
MSAPQATSEPASTAEKAREKLSGSAVGWDSVLSPSQPAKAAAAVIEHRRASK